MLMTRDRWVSGMISGGCLESELIGLAWELTEQGPAIHVFDASSESDAVWGYGLGCAGTVYVLLERVTPQDFLLTSVLKALNSGRSCTLHTMVEDGPLLGLRAASIGDQYLGATELIRQGCSPVSGPNTKAHRLFVEHIEPALKIAILGAGHDAIPLAEMARRLGWRVVVIDSRPEYLTAERFPGADQLIHARPKDPLPNGVIDSCTYVVLMTHNYMQDIAILETLLSSDAVYIGLLGPRARRDRLVQDLGLAELPQKLHGPVGLDIGAEGPEEIALAILSEIQAVSASRKSNSGRSLP